MTDISYTTPGITREDSITTIEILQHRLAAYNDLHLTLKHVHWNVVGPNFIGVHEMLDPQVELVRGFADEVAERIATMGGSPQGTTSAIAKIRDWGDLVKPGVAVITPNPKTSGGARWNHLAAYGYALRQPGGSPASAKDYLAKLYKNVPVLAKGGRDATATFLQRNIGDVLITFESEVVSVNREFGVGKVDVVYPSVSVTAENPVAVVERTAAKKGTGELAKAYLDFLYTDEAQEIAARHAIRPRSEAVLKKHADLFKPVQQFTVGKYFGSLAEAQKVHFNDGGQFDKLYTAGAR